MKKFLYKRHLLLAAILVVTLQSCDKFPLIKDESMEAIPAGTNLKSKTIWEFVSENNFHEGDQTKLSTYGRAIEYTGLKDFLNADGNFSAIIFDNVAMELVFERIGYKGKQLTDIPPALIKNILLNNMVNDARVRSFDLAINEVRGYQSLGSDSIYFIRNATAADQYFFYVSKSRSTTISPRVTVRTQNLEFKNGTAVVVSGLATYDKPLSVADPIPSTIPTQIIFATKDAHTQNGVSNVNKNFGTAQEVLLRSAGSDLNFERRALLQFPVVQPTFSGRIGFVQLGIYVTSLNQVRANLVDIYEDQNVQWVENTLTWSNAPAKGTDKIGSISIAGAASIGKYVLTDVTAPMLKILNSGKVFTNIGLQQSVDLVGFRSKEGSTTLRPYISYSPSPASILTKVNNTALVAKMPLGLVKISKTDLSFSGTDDKNISYFVKSLPTKGFLVRNERKLELDDIFKQDEFDSGVIKYIVNDRNASGTDSFTLEVKDFQGGYFPSLITVPVQIQ